MQHFIIYKIAAGSWMSGLLMVIASMVTTAILAQNGFASQPLHPYTMQQVVQQTNPWALPQAVEEPFRKHPRRPDKFRFHAGQMGQFITPEHLESLRQQKRQMQQTNRFRKQPIRPHKHRFHSGQMGQFITPEHLESLRQQKKQMQMMPQIRQYNQLMQRRLPSAQFIPQQPWSAFPRSGFYASPLHGMGNVNPLSDTSAVSPWVSPWMSPLGGEPDIAFPGGKHPGEFSGSLPWMPD